MPDTSKASSCRPQTLARNSVAHVQRCVDCGCISVHMGPVTVRLDASSLEALGGVLREASAQLRTEARTTWLRTPERGLA